MKILLADDDKFLQKFTGSRLTKLGFEVIVAADGEETLIKMKNDKPAVVLLDLIMPNKDGFSVLEEAKKDPAISNIPIIVISSLEQEDDVKRVKDLGASDFFDKTSTDYEPLKQKIIQLTTKQTL